MGGLPPPLVDLAFGAQQAIHGWHGAEITALVREGGIDAGWRLVHEALLVQEAEHLGAFGRAERARLGRRSPSGSGGRRSRVAPVLPVVGRPRLAEGGTRRPRADQRRQVLDRLVSDHVGSPPVGASLLVASCSSSAESFPCTSITRRAVASSASRRAVWRRSRASSCSRGSAARRPGAAARATSAPSSRSLRHFEICEVYRPSRRNKAPRPVASKRSYSATMRAL